MNFTQVGVLQSHTGQQARHTLVRAASANFLTAVRIRQRRYS